MNDKVEPRKFADRVVSKANPVAKTNPEEPVASVEYGGVVANIYHTPNERRGQYLVNFERHFQNGDEIVASDRVAPTDLKNVAQVAKLAEKKIQELQRERSGHTL